MITKNISKIGLSTIRKKSETEGESIERKVERIVNNREPISDGAPLIYMERKEGVNPAYDIRTDRWEIAIDGMDKVAKTKIAKREEKIGKPEPIQGTEPGQNPAA